ncbi:MAG: 50S ribosomal protein L3 [Labilithrix sp.]|nr:50S ribosomal protein L3 [Labilithrix sp.]
MNTKPGIIGKKLGFTQLYKDDGTVQRVTVVDMSAVSLVGKRTKEKDGYTALVFGITDAKEKHLTKADLGAFKKKNVAPKRDLRELRCSEEFAAKFEVGAPINIGEIFQAGQLVDARGKTRGRGFTGVVRRWSFAGFVSTHGTHEYRRHGGSIGTNMTPGRTLPNLKMPGQYGDETVSVLNMRVARVDAEKGLLMIEGGIPGSKNQLVLVRHAVKERLRKAGR